MNLSVKTMPWMVASLLAVTSVFGQNQNQNQGACTPQPPVCKPAPRCGPLQAPQQPMNCAYNAPAEINVGMVGDIDFFASGSFLYWQPSQDNMEFALTSNNVLAGFGVVAPEPAIQGSYVEMNFKYKPGFKVGMGMNLQTDDWDGFAEYTRVHGSHYTATSGPNNEFAAPSLLATWGHPFLANENLGGQLYNYGSEYYTNNLDFIDAEIGRTYYVGKSLIFRSAWGARAAWITQNVHVHYLNDQSERMTDPTTSIVSFPSVVDVYQRLHSWALGPRAGLCMDWMLGMGVRYFGSAYGDVLYTKYTVQDKNVLLPTAVNNGAAYIGVPVSVVTSDQVGTLRSHLDFEMGFGWGSYFDNNNWHVDLSAAYGWQVFFDQNMFRHYNSTSFIGGNLVANGNLYVQGLTVTARVDF